MGFELEETLYRLKFEDPKYAGLEVLMREPTIGSLVDLAALDTEDDVDPNVLAKFFKLLSDSLVEWNLEKKGVPVPTDIDSIKSQPTSFVMDILKAWQINTVGISAPLDDDSMNGKPPAELSLQTVV